MPSRLTPSVNLKTLMASSPLGLSSFGRLEQERRGGRSADGTFVGGGVRLPAFDRASFRGGRCLFPTASVDRILTAGDWVIDQWRRFGSGRC
jgi:hypothetical protein